MHFSILNGVNMLEVKSRTILNP